MATVTICGLSNVQFFCDPMDCSLTLPLCMEFSRKEYWSGLPFPSLGDLPNPGFELRSPAFQADSLPSGPPDGICPRGEVNRDTDTQTQSSRCRKGFEYGHCSRHFTKCATYFNYNLIFTTAYEMDTVMGSCLWIRIYIWNI